MADRPSLSPFTLLAEAPAEEVLILTFAANLGFFERFALAESRRSGARVTVVYDAQAEASDPRGVRFAGVNYLPGAAICKTGGAFHPKLIVCANEEAARVMVGSGNLTPGGWHQNAELWTLLRADEHEGLGTLRDLAEWLLQLPSQVRFSAGVDRALNRVAELLSGFPVSEAGPSLVSSLHEPIIDQLPEERADELVVCAPFLDAKADAIAQLQQRFGAPPFRLALQSTEAVFDGAGLVQTLDQLGGEALEVADPDRRYHHAKLIEWHRGGVMTSLTGSPNLTRRALLRSMRSGGNCELALIERVDHSLLPETTAPIPRERLLARQLDLPPQDAQSLVLLSAVLNVDGTSTLTPGRGVSEPATLERLVDGQWHPLQEVDQGSERIRAHGFLAPGTPLRLHGASGRVSNVAYLVSLERATRRLQPGAPSRPPPDPNDLFDIAVVEGILAEVAELKSHIAPPSTGGATGSAGAEATVSKPHSWRDLLEDRTQRHGDPLMAFALGLPGLATPTSHQGEVFDEDAAGDLDAEQQEQAMAEVDAVDQTNRRISSSTALKRRYLRALERIAALAQELLDAGRLLALRILLRSIALTALWDDEISWSAPVADATVALSIRNGGVSGGGPIAGQSCRDLSGTAPQPSPTLQRHHHKS